jgi:mycofactocin precursor
MPTTTAQPTAATAVAPAPDRAPATPDRAPATPDRAAATPPASTSPAAGDALVLDTLLVEDVSIDGMCGVY